MSLSISKCADSLHAASTIILKTGTPEMCLLVTGSSAEYSETAVNVFCSSGGNFHENNPDDVLRLAVRHQNVGV